MLSVDFQEVKSLQRAGKSKQAGEILAKYNVKVENAGADFLLICTNTMNRVASRVEAEIDIRLIHIADTTVDHIKAQGIKKSVH